MTDNLFHKAVTITDVHFGRRSNSPQANQDNIDFIAWVIERAKTWGAKTCIMMGDWHDNRNSLNVLTLDYSLKAIEMLNDAFDVVHWIPGNHDLYYREKRDVSSISFSKYLPNINIIAKPQVIGGVHLLPWLVGDEHAKLKHKDARYAFGHLEIGGFKMNARVELPETEKGLKYSAFDSLDYAFTGHFHIRQQKGRVLYTGNIMPFDFSDAWDDDRGMMMLEWGKEPIFEAWPDQPLFRTMKLSELLANPKQYLKPKMTARVFIDTEITFEESQYIKDTMTRDYDLRKFELGHLPRNDSGEQVVSEALFQSVDEIVIDGLSKVESIGLRPSKLIDIYSSLRKL
jgi:hypothetical protein